MKYFTNFVQRGKFIPDNQYDGDNNQDNNNKVGDFAGVQIINETQAASRRTVSKMQGED